ncbi:MAG: hypothetical protein DMG38_29690 [Acidobacteria bacterium]|nr:MAG: hypothetical protein DMG38_29690 [Acidobacteriota bacterium]
MNLRREKFITLKGFPEFESVKNNVSTSRWRAQADCLIERSGWRRRARNQKDRRNPVFTSVKKNPLDSTDSCP